MMCASDQYSSTVFLKRSNLDGRAPDTRISSPLTAPRLCVTIGRYWYLSKRLTAVLARRFYRFEYIVHIVLSKHIQSTFKATYFEARLLFLRQWKVYVLPKFKCKTSTAVSERLRREREMNKRKLGSF